MKKLIIGLGNPDKKYENTRHNTGFIILDALCEDWHFDKKFNAAICERNNLIYAKPQTFMNNSGQAVRAIVEYYKIEPADIYIIHDELDLPLGKIKIDFEKSSAGHKGVQSIIDHLGTKNFHRLRIGIQPANLEKRPENYEEFVLKNFGKEEIEIIQEQAKEIKKIIFKEELPTEFSS